MKDKAGRILAFIFIIVRIAKSSVTEADQFFCFKLQNVCALDR